MRKPLMGEGERSLCRQAGGRRDPGDTHGGGEQEPDGSGGVVERPSEGRMGGASDDMVEG